MENYQQMWPWLGGDDVIKTSGKFCFAIVDKLHNHVSNSVLSGFSSKALVNALVDGPIGKFTQSDAFVKALNKRVDAMCQQSIARDDVIDVQPAVRAMVFDIVYGEL